MCVRNVTAASYSGVSLEYLISGSGKDMVSKTNEEMLVLPKAMEEKILKIRRDEHYL